MSPRKNKICWVWREDSNVYVSTVTPKRHGGGWWHSERSDGFCYQDFKRTTGLTLKDEADPIRVRFSVEVLP